MAKEKIKDTQLVCTNCGSPNTESKLWVSNLTGRIASYQDTCTEENDNWCINCEEHCRLILYSEFKIRKND